MRKSRVHLWAVVAVAVAIALGGCGNDGKKGSPARQDYAVGIDIPFHPLFAYVAARRSAYFAGKPYDVHFKVLDTTNLVPAFGAGKLDVIATFPSFLPRIEERYKIVAREFLPLARIRHGMAIWVPKDSSARTLSDLEGDDVAAPPIGQQWGEDEAMIMAATGQNMRRYFKIHESGAPVQQLLLGRVDAAFVSGEAVAHVAKTGRFRPLIDSRAIFKQAYGDGFVLSGGLAAPASFVSGHPRFVADLKAAFADAWKRFIADPDEVLAVAARQSGLPTEQLAGFADAIGLRVTPRWRRRITSADVATWTQLYDALARSGFLARAPADAAKYFESER